MPPLLKALTAPSSFGGLGTILVSIPYSLFTAGGYVIATVISTRGEYRAAQGLKHKTTLSSQGFVYLFATGIALLQMFALLSDGKLLDATAYLGVATGSIAYFRLVVRQAQSKPMNHTLSRSKGNSDRPLLLIQWPLFTNPVVGLTTANILFSSLAPGAFSEPSQMTLLSTGILVGGAALLRSIKNTAKSLKQSLLLGAVSNACLALNAAVGGSPWIAMALFSWTAQNVSAYLREKDLPSPSSLIAD
ncbi:hypothetical protein MRY87_11125 [bacterium]|nr:hypothetical protein [bacterium]